MIIGRQGEQKIPITDKTVSRKHCELIPSGITPEGKQKFILKDLGSTEGTFVDGKRILQTIVNEDTIIQLGTTYSTSVSKLIGKNGADLKSNKSQKAVDITALSDIYQDYNQSVVKLQKSAAMKNFYRSLPPVLTSVLFALTLLLGDNETIRSLRPFMGILTIIAIGCTTFVVWRGQKEMPEKRAELDDQFKINYVCPHCHNFLGNIPYEGLLKKGECNYCRCKWIGKHK